VSSYRQANDPGTKVPPVVSTFHVGAHVVRLSKLMEGRWAVAVDEGTLATSYRTQADAWEAGVREADRLDRPAPR
jgi:predicted metalloprotease with PDZ domain